MSKVLLINGSPNEKGCTYTALREVAESLNREGLETQIRWIGNKMVAGCIDCSKCRPTGLCCFNDMVNEISRSLDGIDAIVVGSPVYYAGPSGQLCCLLDRLFHSSGKKMKGKVGASVVSCRRSGSTAALDRLNKYFTISNMYVAGSQYYNQVHGYCPEDVQKDLEGLQTMRSLGKNIAYLLELNKNRQKPEEEDKRYYSNFIKD